MLRILGRDNSINVRKVLWLCEELGQTYAREDWGQGYRSTDDPEFRALNPVGMIPVVVDGEVVLWESNVILRYLAAKHGRTDLLPEDPAARARVEIWMDWQASDFSNALRGAFHGLVRKNPDYADPAAIEASRQAWIRMMEVLEGQLKKTGGHVAGPDFTLADIPIGLTVNRWFMTPIERPDLPEVAAYYDVLNERPAYRAHGRNGVP